LLSLFILASDEAFWPDIPILLDFHSLILLMNEVDGAPLACTPVAVVVSFDGFPAFLMVVSVCRAFLDPTVLDLPAGSHHIKKLEASHGHSDFVEIKSDIPDELDVVVGISSITIDPYRFDKTGLLILP
jgi:hypothetical protein